MGTENIHEIHRPRGNVPSRCSTPAAPCHVARSEARTTCIDSIIELSGIQGKRVRTSGACAGRISSLRSRSHLVSSATSFPQTAQSPSKMTVYSREGVAAGTLQPGRRVLCFRLLLRQTVDSTESPDEIRGVDSDHAPAREKIGQRV